MYRFILAANIAAIPLVPSIAGARTQSQATCEEQRSTRVVATIGGAAAGGVLGNVVAGRGDKTVGTVIGAAAGAVLANQIAKPTRDCRDAFGYYDNENRWHATGVNSSDARGYYDRDGIWVDGPPNGRYGSDDRWVTYAASSRGEGDYRPGGEWVPASANGYYDRDDIWVPGSASGRYDDRGRWIGNAASATATRRDDAYGYYDTAGAWHATSTARGRATGYYDRDNKWVTGTPNGYYDERRNWIPQREDGTASGSYDGQNRWIPASSAGYYDDNDRWISGAASGHYDQRGRWVAGVTVGHYDANGRWIAGAAGGRRDANGHWVADPHPGYYDRNGRWNAGATTGYYDARGRWVPTGREGMGSDYGANRPAILSQLANLDRYVRTARSERTIDNRTAMSASRELRSIRASERAMHHDRMDRLSERNEAALQSRIDRLNLRLRLSPQ